MQTCLSTHRGRFVVLLVLASCGGGGGGVTQTQTTTQITTPPPPAVPRSSIKNLMIVVLQNNSFDHLFGTSPSANGLNSSLPSYHQIDQAGSTITPQLLSNLSPDDLHHTRTSYLAAYDSGNMDKYAWENGDVSMDYFDSTSIGTANDGQLFGVNTLWSYAQQYALADNFFASAMASEPSNMLYMTAANVGAGSDPYGYPQLDACSAALYQLNKGIGATITPPLTFQNVGDQLSSAKISWTWFPTNIFLMSRMGPACIMFRKRMCSSIFSPLQTLPTYRISRSQDSNRYCLRELSRR